jgi:hypothetical protein
MREVDRGVVVESSIVARWVRRIVMVSRSALAPQGDREIPVDVDGWRVVDGSWLVKRVESVLRVVGTAWRNTIATGLLQPVARGLQALDPAGRVRLIGWVLFVAALVTGAWRALDGVASWSVLLSIATMLAAFAVMKGSAGIVTAWTDRFKDEPGTY